MLASRALVLGILLIGTACFPLAGRADGPQDNRPENVRPIPPRGIEIPAEQRQALLDKLRTLGQRLQPLRASPDPQVIADLPDVEIFFRAVDQALRHNELFEPADVGRAQAVLDEGLGRAESLARGEAPWKVATGLVVRGFRSRLDNTVQPYGVVVPAAYAIDGGDRPRRADVWCHGRQEQLLEVPFIHTRMTQVGEIAPDEVLVIHPFGRYCNANKLAGEVDTLEALAHARSQYRIDPDRIAIRGFSMGGAATWHLAVHYPDLWFAATPGAGFSETPDFLRVFQSETVQPTWWEQTLWGWYDCPAWALNLRQLPTIAYSGALDKQKQAADVMVRACRELSPHSFEMLHLVAPQTAHRLHPEFKIEIERRLAALAKPGRDKTPITLVFTTRTLRYNRMHWLTVDALGEHWKPARVEGKVYWGAKVTWDAGLRLEVDNVRALSVNFDFEQLPPWPDLTQTMSLLITDNSLPKEAREFTFEIPLRSDRSWGAQLAVRDGQWRIADAEPAPQLRKRHGLQGPIDDALLDSFLFVEPSRTSAQPAVEAWVRAEFDRAVKQWRTQMRGDVRIKKDHEVTPDDMTRHHLILWGDRQSNVLLAKLVDQLPIRWTDAEVRAGEQVFPADHHVPLLVYPNPLAPEKYVVLNSSFTYREYDYLNNARQTPKLPDWAIVDVSAPPSSRSPGKVVAADFFDENWQLKPPRPAN